VVFAAAAALRLEASLRKRRQDELWGAEPRLLKGAVVLQRHFHAAKAAAVVARFASASASAASAVAVAIAAASASAASAVAVAVAPAVVPAVVFAVAAGRAAALHNAEAESGPEQGVETGPCQRHLRSFRHRRARALGRSGDARRPKRQQHAPFVLAANATAAAAAVVAVVAVVAGGAPTAILAGTVHFV
jgi:hypothetical protein